MRRQFTHPNSHTCKPHHISHTTPHPTTQQSQHTFSGYATETGTGLYAKALAATVGANHFNRVTWGSGATPAPSSSSNAQQHAVGGGSTSGQKSPQESKRECFSWCGTGGDGGGGLVWLCVGKRQRGGGAGEGGTCMRALTHKDIRHPHSPVYLCTLHVTPPPPPPPYNSQLPVPEQPGYRHLPGCS